MIILIKVDIRNLKQLKIGKTFGYKIAGSENPFSDNSEDCIK